MIYICGSDVNILEDEKRSKVLRWLSVVDFEEVHQKYFLKHFQGTGQWFLEDENFREWNSAPGAGLLWCHGTRKCNTHYRFIRPLILSNNM